MIKKKIFYVAEISLNSNSAYTLQVMKMCDAFSDKGYDVILYIINKNNLSFELIKKKYLLKSNFKIISIFNKINNLNFFLRFFFSLKVFFDVYKKDKNSLIYTRSILTSITLSIFGKKNILEIHQLNTGFTSILFNIFKRTVLIKNVFFVLIHENLNDYFHFKKKKFIILDDCVDLRDFDKVSITKKIKKSCVYTGSLFYGKGFEFIIKLAKENTDIEFYVYGDPKTADIELIKDCKKIKNLKLMGFISYSKIPKILKSHSVILMPYGNKVRANHKTIDISKYMSPLKLFDYLASGQIILASKHKTYSHVLKNGFNSILCETNRLDQWSKKLREIFKNIKKFSSLKKNSINTSKKFTWQKRTNAIIEFAKYNEVFNV